MGAPYYSYSSESRRNSCRWQSSGGWAKASLLAGGLWVFKPRLVPVAILGKGGGKGEKIGFYWGAVTVIWISPCFGYPHTQIPSEMHIPSKYGCRVFCIRDTQNPSDLGTPSQMRVKFRKHLLNSIMPSNLLNWVFAQGVFASRHFVPTQGNWTDVPRVALQ